MSVQIRINSYRIAVQNLADEVMKRKCDERAFGGLPGSVGIWLAVDLTIKAAESEKQTGSWPFKIPDIETVRRLINYLADPEEIDDKVPRPEDSPPKWKHLSFAITDVDPRTGHVRPQSGYVPSQARIENSANGGQGRLGAIEPTPASRPHRRGIET